MAHPMLASVVASVTELKKNPMGTVESGHGEAVAILNRNEPAFYCIPADRYEAMLDYIDELRLAKEVEAVLDQGGAVTRSKFVDGKLVFEDDPQFAHLFEESGQ